MHNPVLLGCIADDFTGGSDAASFLKEGGLKTILCSGIPSSSFILPNDCEAVVIALKSRTQETADAVSDSLAAIRWLSAHGAKKFYIKYCSTFDSTPQGNIGPVVDAVLEYTDTPGTILCPALPTNGRTVYGGILYVNNVPLAESPMKDHPLTPMHRSRIAELMTPQGKYPSLEIHRETILNGVQAMQDCINSFAQGKTHYYVIPDFAEEKDAEILVDCFRNWKVLTGGSGLLKELASRLKSGRKTEEHFPAVNSPALILSGSCSAATRVQTEYYLSGGIPSFQLSDNSLLSGAQNAATIWNTLKSAICSSPLVYSYESPDGLAKKRNVDGRKLSALIEHTLAELAALAVENGIDRIIVAGGETSGAIVKRLGYSAFWIGETIAPGVPVLIPLDCPRLRLVLKSGNFGQPDFYRRALQITGECDDNESFRTTFI